MDKVRLRFWNAVRHFCAFMFVISGVLALLEYAEATPERLENILVSASNLEYLRFLPPTLTRAWTPLAVLSLSFAAVALAAARQKRLWHPAGFRTLPAPNGGYLRKAGMTDFKKELKKASRNIRGEVKEHFKKAEKHFTKNQYRSAAAEYQKSASAFATMAARLNEGIALCYTSHFRKAADAFDRGISMAAERESGAFASAFSCNICIPYRELGSLEEAQASFKQAYGMCMKSADSLGRLCAVGNSGTLLLARGEKDEALQAWRNALEGLKEIRCASALAVALDGAGCALAAKKDFAEALKHHRKALRIFRRHRNLPGITGTLMNIGKAYAGLGRRWRSLLANRKTLRLAARYGSVVEQAAIHADAGSAHARKGKAGDALRSVEKALELYKQVDNPLGAARQLADIAVIYASQKKTDEALKKLAEARRNFQAAEADPAEFRSLEKRITYALRKKPDNAAGEKSSGQKAKNMLLAGQA